MNFDKHPMPGGELQGRPIQGQDGKWYDKLGVELSEDASRDMDYASRFWERQPKGMREVMTEIIEKAANGLGRITELVGPDGITEEYHKEKLSAYRVLAEELGYEVGQYTFDKQTYVASAPISKKK